LLFFGKVIFAKLAQNITTVSNSTIGIGTIVCPLPKMLPASKNHPKDILFSSILHQKLPLKHKSIFRQLDIDFLRKL